MDVHSTYLLTRIRVNKIELNARALNYVITLITLILIYLSTQFRGGLHLRALSVGRIPTGAILAIIARNRRVADMSQAPIPIHGD